MSRLTRQNILIYLYENKINILDLKKEKEKDKVKNKNIIKLVKYVRCDLMIDNDSNIMEMFDEKQISFLKESENIIINEDYLNYFTYIESFHIFKLDTKLTDEETKIRNLVIKEFDNLKNLQNKFFKSNNNYSALEKDINYQ